MEKKIKEAEEIFNIPHSYILHSSAQRKQADFFLFLMNTYVKYFNIKPELILDVGCGPGSLAKYVWKEYFSKAKIIGVDISKSSIMKAKEDILENYNIEYICSNIEDFRYPFKFDVVFSNATMHWIKDQEKVYSNIHDLMKQNSILVVHTGYEGCYKELREIGVKVLKNTDFKKFENFFYPLIYHTKDSIRTLLEKIGFELVQVRVFETDVTETIVDDFIETTLGLFSHSKKLNSVEEKFFVEKFKEEAKRLTHIDTTRLYFVARKTDCLKMA